MSISDDFYDSSCDETVETREWVRELRDTHSRRALIQGQTQQFYFRRRLIEYSVKTTITASMAVALIWGGPPVWIVGGAALMLRLSTLILNRFNPSQYIEDNSYRSNVPIGNFVDDEHLNAFRRQWRNGHENHRLAFQEDSQCALQRRIAFALMSGYVIFSLLNASLTIAIVLAGIVFSDSLIQQAHEDITPYVEEEEAISNLFVH